jgi:hypothetical protein
MFIKQLEVVTQFYSQNAYSVRAMLFQRQGSGSIQNVFPDPCPRALIAR